MFAPHEQEKIRSVRGCLRRAGRAGLSPVPHLAELRLGPALSVRTELASHSARGGATSTSPIFCGRFDGKSFFDRCARKHPSSGLIPPTMIGFTGLALLGRAGELIRPYLIARRQNLPFASQVAVWAVERIFDVGGFTVLMVAAIFLPSKLRAFTTRRSARSQALDSSHGIRPDRARTRIAFGSGADFLPRKSNRPVGRRLVFPIWPRIWAIASRKRFASLPSASIRFTARSHSSNCRPCRS